MHIIRHISILWLLLIAAFCSCSSYDMAVPDEVSLVISGTVSEITSEKPIENVEIIFEAYVGNKMKDPVINRNTFTDSKGTFSIKTEGYGTPHVRCLITTSHEEYVSVQKEIIINLTEISYDEPSGTCFINDCNIHLEKNILK